MYFQSKIEPSNTRKISLFSKLRSVNKKLFFIFLVIISYCTSLPKYSYAQNNNHQKSKKLVVHLFFSFECPLCRKYIPIIEDIQKQYNDLIEFDIIVPEKLSYQADDKKNRKLLEKDFVLIKDTHASIQKHFDAKATPEVILTDDHDKIIYRGKIDDRAVDIGKWKSFSGNNYLKDAIDATLQGKEVIIRSTLPRGCFM